MGSVITGNAAEIVLEKRSVRLCFRIRTSSGWYIKRIRKQQRSEGRFGGRNEKQKSPSKANFGAATENDHPVLRVGLIDGKYQGKVSGPGIMPGREVLHSPDVAAVCFYL
jgi:hypothetical protein